MTIIGAGLAGLIAGHAFPRATIMEASGPEKAEHQAVLRFRTQAVSDLVGIPFRKVTVRKGIWHDGWVEPNIASCNMYAQKVIGNLADRSIWDTGTVERWIAPHDFREQLIAAVGNRVAWNTPVELNSAAIRNLAPVISTAPLPMLATTVLREPTSEKFRYAGVLTTRWPIPGADVFQTVYFPTMKHPLYRASITGDELICEWVLKPESVMELDTAFSDLAQAFSFSDLARSARGGAMDWHEQRFGKIIPIPEQERKRLLAQLTMELGVYSLGRFATWRQIMLDDIPHDVAVIKKMINGTDYERRMAELKGGSL